MSESIITIELLPLSLALIPVGITLWLLHHWTADMRVGAMSVVRMLAQLLIIGYFLNYIFNAGRAWVVLGVLSVMLLAASWIALRTVERNRHALASALLALFIGSGFPLVLTTVGILQLEPWYRADYMVPLAGMMFANGMTALSLAADRFEADLKNGTPVFEARGSAMHNAMIPVINSLFAVGLVSLPGMMTGQILSGVSPLVAVRYQILIMCMVFGASGMTTAIYLQLISGRSRP